MASRMSEKMAIVDSDKKSMPPGIKAGVSSVGSHQQDLHIRLGDDNAKHKKKHEKEHSWVFFLFLCLCVWPMLLVCVLSY